MSVYVDSPMSSKDEAQSSAVSEDPHVLPVSQFINKSVSLCELVNLAVSSLCSHEEKDPRKSALCVSCSLES